MFKKICSFFLAICMVMSLSAFAFADYVYVDSFSENNLPAKKIVLAKGHAFVASGEEDATDTINVYNLSTKQLIGSYSVPVYKTGRNYYVENMYVYGEYMYISFNRAKGWGDPFVRKYEIDAMLKGEFKHIKTTGIRGDHVTTMYEGKLFYTEPGYKTLDLIDAETDTSKDVMSLSEFDRNYMEKTLKGILATKDYFYIYTADEIRAYKTDSLYSGLMQSYHETVAVLKMEAPIDNVIAYEDMLLAIGEEGLEILKVEEKTIKSLAKYTDGGKIMTVFPASDGLYVYADNTKSIQVLDITDIQNIKVTKEVKLSNENTAGVSDIKVEGERIYVADTTKGFGLYSANELDALETETKKEAESFAEELSMSSNRKAIETVVGLNIMELRDNGLFGSDLYITRGEFASSAAKLFGDSINGGYKALEFTDVPSEYEYAESIYGLVNKSVLNGYGDGTFRPENPVLYEHAVKIMIKVLGYYPLVENSNRTCAELAAELGILNNVKAMDNGYISRENVARLIYNSLEVATLKFSSGIDPYKYESSKDDTLLYKMGLKKIKGQITATEYTSLSGGYKASKGKVEINDTQYPEGKSDAAKYLGRNVTAYHKFEDIRVGELVYVEPSDKDDVIVVPAKDVNDSTTKSTFCYYDEDDKLEKVNIENASVILNGIFDRAFTAEDLVPDDGDVMLIDADADGEIETVIVNSYKTYVVDAYTQGVFRLKYGYSEININKLEKDVGKVYVTLDGAKCDELKDITGVKAYTILSVMQSRGKEITDINITNNCVIGMITQSEDNKYITIGDVKYELNKSHIKNAENPSNSIASTAAGEEVYAYLDMFGKIAAVQSAESVLHYGYLMACDRGEGLNTEDVSFKLLVSDESELHGSIKRYKGAAGLKVNGVKTTDIYTVSELFGDGGLKEQLIQFALSAEGQIKEVYTAKDKVSKEISDGVPNPYYEANYPGYTENEFTYDAYVSAATNFRTGDMGSFSGEPFIMTAETEIFMVPINIDDPKDEDYKMYDHNSLYYKSGATSKGNVYMYNIGYDYNIDAMVIKVNGGSNIDTLTNSDKYIVVDSFMKGIDDNGDPVTVLVGAKDSSGTQTMINLLNDDIADPEGKCNSAYQGVKLVDVPKGTVIQYVKNGRGYLEAMHIFYMPTPEKTYFEYGDTAATESSINVAFYTSFAKVIRVAGNRVIFNGHGYKIDDDGDGTGDRQWDGNLAEANRAWDRNLRAADADVYLYDSVTDRIKSATLADILPGDDIFIVKKSVYTDFIVIYR